MHIRVKVVSIIDMHMCVFIKVQNRISPNQLVIESLLFRKHYPIKRNTAETFNWIFVIEHHYS